ncbi:ulp1 protease family, C-terminal catalytic domain-containing protein [Tanacetum coccineum]
MKKSLMKRQRGQKIQKKKETGTTKGKRTRKIEEEDMESNDKDEGSNNENEVLSVVKGKKRETMKKKTKDSNPKEKKLRNNASEDEDDTESKSEEELKKLRKVKIKRAKEDKKQQRSTMGTLENGGRVPTKLLKCIKEEDDLADIDWCDYILDCLRTSKFNWKDEELMADGKNQNENERQSGIQKEKENIENMGKGTEEGGSEANDNGEKDEDDVNIENEFEKVNEKDDEEAVSMDVDDLNEKIKEKEADKEKVSDSIKKEQQVESEKEKQYEAYKDEKVQEIQDEHNRLTHDQFWDKEYDLTDSQYEELEIRATQDIKKKQTPKRNDFVFETKDGAATIRDYMQTLAPQLKVESNVIDTFSIFLNHEQKMNSKGKKIKYFFHTSMITKDDMFKWKKANGEYDEENQFEAFSKTIKSEFKKDPEMKNTKDLEMVFFPIIAHEHYYLVVFNFLKGNIVIIDNSKTQMTHDVKYKIVCELLKKLFFMHLEKVEHPRAKDHYNGETAKNWNLEFPTEKEGNTFDIIKMRVGLATKILSHEINIHREKISTEAQEFVRRNTDKNLRKQMIKEAIKTKKEKQESERVQSAI